MRKRPFLFASLLFGGIFLFFLLVLFAAGMLRTGSLLRGPDRQIGVLEIQGAIDNERLVLRQIDELLTSDAVVAVVLRIDSPGGAVGPSQEIHAELQRLAQSKPLIVSFGSVVASGGYYLAVAGERLFASPGTITGSIGVIMSFPDYQELMGKVGVRTEVIKSGPYKDIGSATRGMTERDRQLLNELIADVHQQFVEAVSAGRSMSVEELTPYVDGRIFTGRQALQIGLIDELGTFNDAVDYAAQQAGISGKPDLVFPAPEKTGLIQRYLNILAGRFIGVELDAYRTPGPHYLWPGF